MKSLLTSLLLFALFLLPGQAAEKNIVFFIADDMGPLLGCYGTKSIHTPNIDALAADGLLFRNAFATTASCSASRSVILSGLHNLPGHLIPRSVPHLFEQGLGRLSQWLGILAPGDQPRHQIPRILAVWQQKCLQIMGISLGHPGIGADQRRQPAAEGFLHPQPIGLVARRNVRGRI